MIHAGVPWDAVKAASMSTIVDNNGTRGGGGGGEMGNTMWNACLTMTAKTMNTKTTMNMNMHRMGRGCTG